MELEDHSIGVRDIKTLLGNTGIGENGTFSKGLSGGMVYTPSLTP